MNSPPSPTTWKLTSPSALLVGVLAAFMLYLALFAHLDPIAAATGFGVPGANASVVPWMHVKAGRDLGIGLMLTALLVARERRALGLIILASVVMPVTDALVVIHASGRVAYALGVHGSAALYGLLLGPWLLQASGREDPSHPPPAPQGEGSEVG